jgi:transposase
MAENGRAHQWNYPPVGRPSKSPDSYQKRLKELISKSPRDYGYPFTRWTAQWLSRHLATEFGVEYSTRHIYRLLKQMGASSQQRKQQIKDSLENKSASSIVIGHLEPISG